MKINLLEQGSEVYDRFMSVPAKLGCVVGVLVFIACCERLGIAILGLGRGISISFALFPLAVAFSLVLAAVSSLLSYSVMVRARLWSWAKLRFDSWKTFKSWVETRSGREFDEAVRTGVIKGVDRESQG